MIRKETVSNKQLLQDVLNQACSCDMMIGWTCLFCQKTLPKLRKALKVGYRKTKSPYEPRKIGNYKPKSPYEPRGLRELRD